MNGLGFLVKSLRELFHYEEAAVRLKCGYGIHSASAVRKKEREIRVDTGQTTDIVTRIKRCLLVIARLRAS
jgi:hypothetical protein